MPDSPVLSSPSADRVAEAWIPVDRGVARPCLPKATGRRIRGLNAVDPGAARCGGFQGIHLAAAVPDMPVLELRADGGDAGGREPNLQAGRTEGRGGEWMAGPRRGDTRVEGGQRGLLLCRDRDCASVI
jgi:hypothetical protein